MVNETLRAGSAASPRGLGHAREPPGQTDARRSLEHMMATPKPLMAKSSGSEPADKAVQSALRTLDAEGSGIAAISAAFRARSAPPLPPPSI